MASYSIFFKQSVAKDLRSIPKKDVQRILKRIDGLIDDPRPVGEEKLSGDEKDLIRQGNYRILYTIEMTFRHCKDLLYLPKLMNKRQDYLEKMIALTLIAFIITLLFGETQRDVTYGKLEPHLLEDNLFRDVPKEVSQHRKWRLFSGPFVFLIQKSKLSDHVLDTIAQAVLALIPLLVYGNVTSFVGT